jgi:hypothetical protein
MSLFAANLDALAAKYPEAAAKVAAAADSVQGEWSPSRSGALSVRRWGLSLCSAFDPAVEARRAVPEWSEADFALLPGLGAGYLAQAVAERYPDLPVVIAEQDPSWFREVLGRRDLSSLWDNAVPLIGPDPSVVGAFFGSVACHQVATLPWRPLAEQEPEWYGAVADERDRAQVRAGVNAATFRRFGTLWRRNLARNETQVDGARPLTALKDRWRGSPAVITAAGPSLAENLDWIERHRDRLVLIAVDTAWQALQRRGLEPDVVLVLDGQYWNGRHLDAELPERTLVVTEFTGPPRAFRVAPGRVYVAATSAGLLRRRELDRWGDLGALPTGGSVATAAWSLALYLGCREIAFAGLDLGYPGGTHVRGSQFEETALRLACRLRPAETAGFGLRGLGLTERPAMGGGTVPSDVRMDLFREWLSAAVAARSDVRAVNFSRRGSVISGLLSPDANYGDDWPALDPQMADSSRPLTVRTAGTSSPPWDSLERCLDGTLTLGAFGEAVATLSKAAREYWGASWESWAGRELASWNQFPSARTRRRLVELAALTLRWRWPEISS